VLQGRAERDGPVRIPTFLPRSLMLRRCGWQRYDVVERRTASQQNQSGGLGAASRFAVSKQRAFGVAWGPVAKSVTPAFSDQGVASNTATVQPVKEIALRSRLPSNNNCGRLFAIWMQPSVEEV